MKRELFRVVSLVLVLSLLLCGCSNLEKNDEETEAETIKVEVNTDLVTAPSVEYVIACLENVDTITGIETEDLSRNDPLPASGMAKSTATVYFSSSLVENNDISQSAKDLGTAGGGSIDIFTTSEDAEHRNKYLTGFDNGLLDSGYHTVVGTLVIRTSRHLDKEEQKTFETSIITALTSGEVDPSSFSAETTEPTVAATTITSETVSTTIETEPGQVLSPISSEEYEGMHYENVVALFKNAGFTNVSAVEFPTIADPMIGYSNGYVGGITINDSYSFDKVTPFTEDVAVVISYATWPETTAVDTIPLETEPPVVETEARENMVWIPNSGAKYHSRAGCSNMENPREVTEREAKAMGYTPCKRCH